MDSVIAMYRRKDTRTVHVGNVAIGGQDRVVLQTMTKAPPKSETCIEEIRRYSEAGAELVRVAVNDAADARAIRTLKEETDTPLVADIHFDHRLALTAIESGVDKIRINPGNLNKAEHVRALAEAAKARNVPIRIGVNSGSLEKDLVKRYGRTKEAMVGSARRQAEMLESYGHEKIVVSLKASDVTLAVEANLLAAKTMPYPLHIGITEAGTYEQGTVQSSAGLGVMLFHGIGDTIRVSLTERREDELRIGRKLLSSFGLIKGPKLIACPTCGRLAYDMDPLVRRIEAYLEENPRPITVAIMGCAVNGPDEAKEADVGIAGGKESGLLFKKGEVVRRVPQDELYDTLVEAIENL